MPSLVLRFFHSFDTTTVSCVQRVRVWDDDGVAEGNSERSKKTSISSRGLIFGKKSYTSIVGTF